MPKLTTSPQSLLVTGGAGFIGANFVHFWLAKYPQTHLVVLDALTYAGNRASLSKWQSVANFHFVKGDIRDQSLVESILLEHSIDTLVHFAAESHVDRSIPSPDAFIETNIIGTFSLLKAAKSVWLDRSTAHGLPLKKHRFHHVSTDEVYGSLAADEPAFTEQSTYAPNSPYAASKAASDHLVRAYQQTYGLQVSTSNCSNCYGPFQYPEKLIPLVITNILRNKPIPIFGDGQQIRDWLYVEDHIRAIELILKGRETGQRHNIGGENEWKNIDLVRYICNKMNHLFRVKPELAKAFPQALAAINNESEKLISHVHDRAGHDRRYAVSIDKSKQDFGYAPTETFDTGIQRTIEWYLENQSWWQPLLS
ncbi:dTDP-glucose 4,6-dehydratase [Simiduia curdlanivorans]|uniref:dTDP-glucose 4,6-dehydratase n=1 Tax=Simiduia curdlanivorans TaxID=1492769 RepID=A0ABV8V7L8_9GAMM|nr:dTDP-glucose 4,6-dehydratase [Simiduia curdlanivorans]MDN3639928.1 dTDP-glucose 4,6-dehydratase [Simiduia curdlanivorans]